MSRDVHPSKNDFSNIKHKKPSQKLAKTAARKMPNRIEIDESAEIPKNEIPKNETIIENDQVEQPGTPSADTGTTFYITHILPKINTPEYWREKVLEKRTEIECQPQLDIIDRVVQLNQLSDDFKGDFHSTEAFISMYSEILDIQNAQNFTASSWKILSIPMPVAPLGGGRVFLSGIFHSRANVDIFSSWTVNTKNTDFNIIPEPFARSDVQREIPLDENGPPYTQARPADWSNQSLNDISLGSTKNYSFEFEEFESGKVKGKVPSVSSEDEQTFYGFKTGPMPNSNQISVIDAMELLHSIIEVNSKDEHRSKLVKNSTPVKSKKSDKGKIEKRAGKRDENLGRKMTRYIPMSFFAEFISSFLKK